jgi:hypothetical protein
VAGKGLVEEAVASFGADTVVGEDNVGLVEDKLILLFAVGIMLVVCDVMVRRLEAITEGVDMEVGGEVCWKCWSATEVTSGDDNGWSEVVTRGIDD